MSFYNRIKERFSASSFRKNLDGSTAITTAIIIPITIAGLAFGSEYGYFEYEKRRLQNAADTAAYSAGTQLRSGLSTTEQRAAALLVAEEGGYDDATGTLTLANPPLQGAFIGDATAIHVTLQQPMQRRFSKIFSSAPVNIVTQSTVQVRNGRPACILSLHPTSSDAVEVNGSTTVTLTGCDVAANSISTTAVTSGGAAANLETECVSTVGGVSDPHGNFTYNGCPGAIENGPVTADPYAHVPDPSLSCTSFQSANSFLRSGNPSTPGTGTAGSVNCYDNVGNLTRDVHLEPNEIYVLRNSDLRLSGSDILTGTNVVLYLTGTSSITITGGGTIDISAPTSGVYSGIAIYGDRNNEIDLDLSGNTGVSVVGAIYSPNQNSDIVYIGNTSGFSAGECTQVIAGGQVTLTGDSDFDTDCSNSGTVDIRVAQGISIVE